MLVPAAETRADVPRTRARIVLLGCATRLGATAEERAASAALGPVRVAHAPSRVAGDDLGLGLEGAGPRVALAADQPARLRYGEGRDHERKGYNRRQHPFDIAIPSPEGIYPSQHSSTSSFGLPQKPCQR